MATITANQIIWDYQDWLGGLHPQYDGSSKCTLFSGLLDASSFNPFRGLGYASVGEPPTDATNVAQIAAVLKGIEYIEGADSFAVGGTLVHAFNQQTNTISTTSPFPHTVASSVMQDLIQYKIGTTNHLFYSWYDGTDGDVGRLITSGSTFDDDFMSTVPADAAVLKKDIPLPLVIGDDDIMYIGNGNVLASFDGQTGANGTFVSTALTLPTQYIIKSYAKLSDRTLVIFASTNETNTSFVGSVKAFFWDYVSADPYKICDIFGSKAGGAFQYNGTIGIFTEGISSDPGTSTRGTHLSLYNGDRFVKTFSFKGSAPIKNGVEVQGSAIYANISGTVYSIDSPFEEIKAGVQKIAKGGGTTPGALKTISSGIRLISSGATTNGGLEYFAGNYDIGSVETNFATPLFGSSQKGKIKKIRVEFMEAVTGGRTVNFYLCDRDGTAVATITGIGTITSGKTIVEYTINTAGTQFSLFDALQLKILWGTGVGQSKAPIIKRVIVEFDKTNTLI